MNNLMIDIETLGTSSTAAILSIAAVYFDPLTGALGEEFNRKISLDANIKAGRTIDSRTLQWWMSQDKTAQDNAFCFKTTEETKLTTVLKDFAKFIKPDTKPWGNGATFDITIIQTAFDRCKLQVPWAFWNVRDVRTAVELGMIVGVNPKSDIPFTGVRHDALDDSKHQVKYLSAIFKAIGGL